MTRFQWKSYMVFNLIGIAEAFLLSSGTRSRTVGYMHGISTTSQVDPFGIVSRLNLQQTSTSIQSKSQRIFQTNLNVLSPKSIQENQKSLSSTSLSSPSFIIREATIEDLSQASTILTDGFFSDSTNLFTYQVEKLKTFLSLKSCFPNDPTMHKYYVACHDNNNNNGKRNTIIQQQEQHQPQQENYNTIIGFVEIDCRPLTQKTNIKSTKKRPYMCNLAIDESYQRQGVASALITQCETLAIENIKNVMWLKVRASNNAAVKMYTKLGYRIDSSEEVMEEKNRKNGKITLMLTMTKDLIE